MNMTLTRWTLAVAMTVLVAACGGSGSSGSNPSATGTMKTMYVTGAISGFGSVIVNGVHYESDSANVTLEGHSGTVGQLKVGEVVHLKAEIDAQGNAHARTIDQQRLIQGVVQAVDIQAGTLTIAGQVIKTDNATMFDPSIPGGTLAGIAVGDRIEVHGFVSVSGEALATRIEKAAAGDHEIEVTGPLSALDTVAMRFTVGTQVVDYSTATLEGFPASGPVDGDIVEAQGTTLLADGALKATRVHKEDGELHGHHGDGGELEGLVTRFVSATDFDVAGQPVTTTPSTIFVGGTAADLKMDVRVEVQGTLDASGTTLVADKVVFKLESSLKLSAAVEAVVVDGTGGTLQMLGITFLVTADTRKEDHQTDNHFFSLADVHVGDWVEVSGYPDPAGSGNMIATKLERHSPGSQVELRGPSDQLAAPTFKIAGVSIDTTTAVFEDGDVVISATDFFAKPAGLIVEVGGSWTAPSLLATKVQIEHEDGGSGPPHH